MNDDPGGWEPVDPDFFTATEFDLLEQEDEIRRYLHEQLRDHYHLEPGEAAAAADRYLRSRTGPLPEYPDLIGAAHDAYTQWAGVTNPAAVELRESAQQLAAWESDTAHLAHKMNLEADAASHRPSRDNGGPGTTGRWLDDAITARLAAEATGPGATLHNPAYLARAAATLADLHANMAVDHHSHPGLDPARDGLGSAADDLAAAEAAITLLRENRDPNWYTQEDAATARALRGVLDAAKVWDTVTAAAPACKPWPLEAELRPDRVRSRPEWDDTVILDAGFAGAVITIQRAPGTTPGAAAGYEFLASGPGGPGPLRDVDTTGIGVVAAGDRAPRPTRADVYADLGAQVRHHLIGLADAVATHREALHTRESRRAETTQIAQVNPGRPGPGRTL